MYGPVKTDSATQWSTFDPQWLLFSHHTSRTTGKRLNVSGNSYTNVLVYGILLFWNSQSADMATFLEPSSFLVTFKKMAIPLLDNDIKPYQSLTLKSEVYLKSSCFGDRLKDEQVEFNLDRNIFQSSSQFKKSVWSGTLWKQVLDSTFRQEDLNTLKWIKSPKMAAWQCAWSWSCTLYINTNAPILITNSDTFLVWHFPVLLC